jgi:transmembrane sensor
MAQEYIWNLIAKKLSGEATDAELRELEKLLRENPDLHYPVQTILDLWMSNLKFDQREAHDAFKKHVSRMKDLKIDYNHQPEEESLDLTSYKKERNFKWPAIVLVVLIGIVFIGTRYFGSDKSNLVGSPKTPEQLVSQISTKNGTKTNLILPDGTKVWLNAGSNLSFDSSYGKNIREVSLSGEAFFDVVKNKEKPFIIHTSKINIKVLGTQFNVRSYPSDKTTEASLIRGSIEVTFRDKPSRKIILKPNEKIVVNNEQIPKEILEAVHQGNHGKGDAIPGVDVKNLTHEYKTGVIIETSWVENKLIFQDESFDDIARQLERWYGVTIVFKNRELKENHLTGSFKNETIRQALDALKFTAAFNYEMDLNNNVTIY